MNFDLSQPIPLIGLLVMLVCILVVAFWLSQRAKKVVYQPGVAAPAAPQASASPDREQVIAAVSAVIAEELGTSASNIRICSFVQK